VKHGVRARSIMSYYMVVLSMLAAMEMCNHGRRNGK
jgi:hypothetical protein